MDLVVDFCHGDTPTYSGQYVAYVKSNSPEILDKKILTYIDGIWSHPGSDQKFRGAVYGFVGPLPAIKRLGK